MDQPEPNTQPAQPKNSRRLLYGTGLVLATWMTSLFVMSRVEFTPVVNQAQVRRADMLVYATTDDAPAGSIRVIKARFGPNAEGDVIAVSNLSELKTEPGKTYIFPLWRDGKIVNLSNAAKPGTGRPAIYPDTESVRAQIEAALKRGRIIE